MRAFEEVLKKKDIPYRTGVISATLCTFRIGGRVGIVIEPRCVGELIAAAKLCVAYGLPFAVIGRGSNLLFDDGEIKTVLIRSVFLDGVRVTQNGIFAHCGTSLMKLSHIAAREGLGGLSFACGIPGTLGGGLFMNAGAYGKSLADIVKQVRVLDFSTGEIKTLFNHQLNYSYRKSRFQTENEIVLDAFLALQAGADSQKLLREIVRLSEARKKAQPISLPSAGSVFRRPSPELPISKIIDELGLKGLRVGGAAVAREHAGFIVNVGGASAADVKKLISDIQKIVERERGIRPATELRFIPSE